MYFPDKAIQRVLAQYEARSAEETKRWLELERADFERERDQFLLAVGPETGQFMNLLIKEAKAKVILEVGTSYGYSTLWLAEAARATGGRVISLELQASKQQYARDRLMEVGLADVVDFRVGDAQSLLGKLDTNVDFVLLDLWKDLYIPCFDRFHPQLNPNAIVVADNMLFPGIRQDSCGSLSQAREIKGGYAIDADADRQWTGSQPVHPRSLSCRGLVALTLQSLMMSNLDPLEILKGELKNFQEIARNINPAAGRSSLSPRDRSYGGTIPLNGAVAVITSSTSTSKSGMTSKSGFGRHREMEGPMSWGTSSGAEGKPALPILDVSGPPRDRWSACRDDASGLSPGIHLRIGHVRAYHEAAI
jgi:predicted O-methyltransferase YrrM